MRAARLAALALALAACAGMSEDVQQTAENVLTLQQGTVGRLRARCGTGPFADYDLPPGEMLGVVERAARRAVGCGGRPVTAVFVSRRYGEVVAKERAPEDAADPGYEEPFRSAMLAAVRPVPGRPDRSRVEVHAMERGPFHRGCVAWERDMPGWIREELAARRARRPRRAVRPSPSARPPGR